MCLFHLIDARIFIDRNANQHIKAIGSASLILPNTTKIDEGNGTLVDILSELAYLKTKVEYLLSIVNTTTTTTTTTTSVPISPNFGACSWEGIGCDCYWDQNSAFAEISIAIGSNCTNGILYWTKIINIESASFFISDPCSLSAITTNCDFYF